MIEQIYRAGQICWDPKQKVFHKISDFAKIERDIAISKRAKIIFSVLTTALSLSGLSRIFVSVSLGFSMSIAGSISVIAASISVFVLHRFNLFFDELYSDYPKYRHVREVHRMLNTAHLDWGNGVPDATKSPVKVNPQASLSEKLGNLSNLANYMPNFKYDPRIPIPVPAGGLPHFVVVPRHGLYFYDDYVKERARIILEKCWNFASTIDDWGSYIDACDLCIYMGDKFFEGWKPPLATFNFDQMKLRLPRYLVRLCIQNAPNQDSFDMPGFVAKDLLTRLLPYIQENSKRATISRWFKYCFTEDLEGAKNKMAFLKTLGNTPEEQLLRDAVGRVTLTLEDSLWQELKDARVRHLKLDNRDLTQDLVVRLVQFLPDLRGLWFHQPSDIDAESKDPFAQELRRIKPNLYVSIMDR
jgi:hypothetical protein